MFWQQPVSTRSDTLFPYTTPCRSDQVGAMRGRSDLSSIAQLMAASLEGDSGGAIDLARAQYALGIEPVAMVRGLMDLTHAVTLAKVSRHDDPALAEADRERIGDWAQKLGFAPLNRLWQLLLKDRKSTRLNSSH